MKPKKFAVFDIDGTVFRWQLFSEVVFELMERGLIPKEVRTIVEGKMAEWRQHEHRHSFHTYELAIVEAFFPHLTKLRVADLEAAADAVIQKSGTHLYAYTRKLISRLKAEQYTIIAISGSQDEIVKRFAQLWNFDIAIGQAHDVEDGYYTGTIPNNKLLILQKGDILQTVIEENGLCFDDSYAVGDSKSDAAMMKHVTNPIAFNPDDALYEIAERKGWKIVLERKNMIYELEQKNGTYVLAQANAR